MRDGPGEGVVAHADILNVVRANGGNTGKTAIVYRANLNFHIVKGYLKRLVKKELLTMKVVDGRELYTTTDVAPQFIAGYNIMRAIG